MKKTVAMLMAAAMVVGCAGCSEKTDSAPKADGQAEQTEQSAETAAASAGAITLKVASDYSKTEPIGEALEKWAELVKERGDGSVEVVVYPDSQLGGKTDIIDACLM